MQSIGAMTEFLRTKVLGNSSNNSQDRNSNGLANRGTNNALANINPVVAGKSAESRSVTSQEVLMKRLGEKLGIEVDDSNEPPGPQQVADTVLGFVKGRIDQAAKNGASQEQLQTMVEQAKEGIAKGFGEALDTLEQMGRLDETLEEEIAESRNLVDEGIAQLENKYAYNQSDESDGADSSKGVNGSLEFAQSSQYRRKDSFSFTITTNDGDKVTVRADSSYGAKGEYGFASDGSNSLEQISFEEMASSGYSLSVKGELDEGEMSAITSLFDKVMDVSDKFYGGDVQAAFDMATELELDSSELSSFALNLRQTETASQTTSYRQVGDRPQVPAFVQEQMQGLGQMVQDALAAAEDFESPASLLKGLLAELRPELGTDPNARPEYKGGPVKERPDAQSLPDQTADGRRSPPIVPEDFLDNLVDKASALRQS